MTACILVASLALAVPAARAYAGEDANAILAGARAALGLGGRPAAGIEAVGVAVYRGQDVPFTLTFDSSSRDAAHFGGPTPVTFGYDGTLSWEREPGSPPRFTVLGERDNALLSNWFVTGDWTAPGSPLRFTVAAPSPDSTPGTVILSFTLEASPVTGEVELAEGTFLPRRITWSAGTESTTQEMSGWNDLAGFAIPAVIRQAGMHGEPISIRLSAAGPAAACERSPYEAAFAGEPDTAFDASVPAQLEVRRAPTGHLLVHPLVGGEDLGWFIFDTGAGANVLSSPVADEAGLEAFGAVTALGVGGATQAHFYRAPSLSIGPVTVRDPVFVGMDLSFLDQHMGVRVAGVLGYELLARVIAEFDITSGRIALHDPASYTRDGAAWRELLIYQRHPSVAASFEGGEGVFNLDTGAAQACVTFHLPAIERLGLLKDRATTASHLGGVGGMVSARAGMLEWFELGGRRTEAVPATFITEAVGAYADAYLTGSVGGRLMAPFILVLDYPNRRIAFVERDG